MGYFLTINITEELKGEANAVQSITVLTIHKLHVVLSPPAFRLVLNKNKYTSGIEC